MRTALYTAALMSAALVSAMPADNQQNNSNEPQDRYTGGSKGNSQGNSGSDGNDKFDDNTQPFPLQDGFPNQSPQQLIDIERNAHGTLSNATGNPNAPPLNDDTIKSLQLVATTELLESDFFENFLLNVTEKRPGFDKYNSDDDYNFLVETLTQIVGIEELHAINANNALTGQGKKPIEPAQYVFPVNNLTDAFNVANQLTDGVLSTLQDVVRRLADDGDHGLINGVVSIVGDEGQQDGFFRTQQHRTPAAQPFLTGGDRRFAFSVLENNFIVPGTDKNDIDFPVFLPLNVDTQNIKPEDQELEFSILINHLAGNSDVPSSSGSKMSSSHRRARHARRQESESASSRTSTASVPLSTGSVSPQANDLQFKGGNNGNSETKNNNQGKNDYNADTYKSQNYDWKSNYVVYISEQNVPIVVPIDSFSIQSDKIVIKAFFPGRTNFLDAFTIAAITNTPGPFVSPVDVANHTVAGPGFIEATD